MQPSELFSLKDKVIIVTGGTGVLGTSFVNAITEAGGTVVISGIDEQTCIDRANEINANGGKALGVYANVLEENNLIKVKDKYYRDFQLHSLKNLSK
jgi:NAD(P)-dependent dehydrogenase (short-subunit alcohol dehydrogenase family)